MPAKGEQYKHNLIKDVVYEVTDINSRRRTVELTDTTVYSSARPVRVSYDDLDKNYRKV